MCGLHRKSRNNPPKTIKSISEIREWTKYRALGRPIHLANKNSGNLLLCWKPTPDEDPEAIETALIARFKNSTGDTDLSPISKIKGRGDLYAESRQMFYFALTPILDKLQYLQYEKSHCYDITGYDGDGTILTIVSQIRWYPAQTTQQYLFSPDRVTVLATSVPTVSPSGCGNRWTHRGR